MGFPSSSSSSGWGSSSQADEPEICLPKYVGSMIKPHQIGGVRFMWDNLVEDLEEFKRSDGFGCILAHSMGLGKTLQVFFTWQRERER